MPILKPDEKLETPPTPGVVATHTKGAITVKTTGHASFVAGLKHLAGEIPNLIKKAEEKAARPFEAETAVVEAEKK